MAVQQLLEDLEDLQDLQDLRQAKAEEKDEVTVSIADVKAMLNLA